MSTLFLLGADKESAAFHHAWQARGWRIEAIADNELFDAARAAGASDLVVFDAREHELSTVLELLKAVRSHAAVVARNCEGCHRHSPWSILKLMLADEGADDDVLVERVHEWLLDDRARKTVSLASVLRVATELRLTMDVHVVRNDRREGVVAIVDGLAVAAQHGDESGLHAIREMETLQQAAFTISAPAAADPLSQNALGWKHQPAADPSDDDATREMLGAGNGRFGTVFRVERVDVGATQPETRRPTGEYNIVWEEEEVRAEKRPEPAGKRSARPAYDTDDFPAVVGLDSATGAPGEAATLLKQQVEEAMLNERWSEARELLVMWESSSPQDPEHERYRDAILARRSAP